MSELGCFEFESGIGNWNFCCRFSNSLLYFFGTSQNHDLHYNTLIYFLIPEMTNDFGLLDIWSLIIWSIKRKPLLIWKVVCFHRRLSDNHFFAKSPRFTLSNGFSGNLFFLVLHTMLLKIMAANLETGISHELINFLQFTIHHYSSHYMFASSTLTYRPHLF